jgi:hypothetical protein
VILFFSLPSNSVVVDSLAKVRIGPRCIILIPSYPRGRLPTVFGEKKRISGKTKHKEATNEDEELTRLSPGKMKCPTVCKETAAHIRNLQLLRSDSNSGVLRSL